MALCCNVAVVMWASWFESCIKFSLYGSFADSFGDEVFKNCWYSC